MALRTSNFITIALAIAAPLALAACVGAGIPTKGDVPLAKVDLKRMYVGWYIAATIPNNLERGIVESYDVFSPGDKPGWLREDYYMRRGGFSGHRIHYTGHIQVLPGTNNADWRVKPIWPISLPFQIVYVDPDYRYVLFGEQDRKWGWIYSRTQTIPAADYAELMSKFQSLGWNEALFKRTVQTPDQIGAPGFWSDGVEKKTSERK